MRPSSIKWLTTIFIVVSLFPALISAQVMGPTQLVADADIPAPTQGAHDHLGRDMALSGDTLVISAPDHTSNNLDKRGVVHIYTYAATPSPHWSFVKSIFGEDEDDQFGDRIALHGDYLAISSESNFGTVTLYARNQGGINNWGKVKTINESPLQGTVRRFGKAIAMSHDKMIIGYDNNTANGKDGSVAFIERNSGGADNWGINYTLKSSGQTDFGITIDMTDNAALIGAPESDHNGKNKAGLAYLVQYRPDNDIWEATHQFEAPTAQTNGNFGQTVVFGKQQAFIAQPEDDQQGDKAGAVMVFDQNAGGADQWGLIKTLLPSANTSDAKFGTSIAHDGQRLLVGAPEQSVYGKDKAGAVYVFERNLDGADQWGLRALKINIEGSSGDKMGERVLTDGSLNLYSIPDRDGQETHEGRVLSFELMPVVHSTSTSSPVSKGFGHASVVDQDTLIVGTPLDDDNGPRSGAVFIYDLSAMPAGKWHINDLPTATKLTAPDAASGDYFGTSVAKLGKWLLVGASQDAIYNTSINRTVPGKAYLFEKNGNSWQHIHTFVGTPNTQENFGTQVTLARDTIHISAPRANNTGEVYRYRYQQQTAQWIKTDTLTPDTPQSTNFGLALQVQGQLIAISGQSNTTGFVETFRASTNNPNKATPGQTILPAQDEATFGQSLSLDNLKLAVGCPNCNNVGEVSIYETAQEDQNFGLATTISPPIPFGAATFGTALSMIGHRLHITQKSGLGSVHTFQRQSQNQWTLQASHHPTTNQTDVRRFGASITALGDHLFVGISNTQDLNNIEDGQLTLINSIELLEAPFPLAATAAGARLSNAIASDGNLVVLGAVGVDSIYIVERNKNGRDQWGTLTPRNGPNTYGRAVDIDGDFLVVGSPDSNNGRIDIYQRNKDGQDLWGLVKTITGSSNSNFGQALAIDGDLIAVGAPRFGSALGRPGRVYLYGRNQGGDNNWGRIKTLDPPGDLTLLNNAGFGDSVDLDNGVLVAGRPATFLNSTAGAVYVYEQHDGGTNNWGRVASLANNPSTVFDGFGQQVYIKDDIIVASSASRNTINIFGRQVGTQRWDRLDTLSPTGVTGLSPRCGTNVVISRDDLYVGCPNASINNTLQAGVVVHYKRHKNAANTWSQTKIQSAPLPQAFAHYGATLAIASSSLVVGAPDYNSATELNVGGVIFNHYSEDLNPTNINLTGPSGMVATEATIEGTGGPRDWIMVTIKDSSGKVWAERTIFNEAYKSQPWSLPPITLPPGNYTAFARTQRQGKWGTASTISFDVVGALFLTIDAPEDGAEITAMPAIFGTGRERTLVTVRMVGNAYDETNTILVNTQNQWALSWPDSLADGAYTITASISDMTETVTQTIQVIVDTVAPNATITFPTQDASLNTVRPSFVCSTEPNATITYELYDDQNTLIFAKTLTANAQGQCDHVTEVDLADGSYTLDLSTLDSAGNTQAYTDIVSFEIDTIKPPLNITSPTGTIKQASPNIQGTTQANLDVVVEIKQNNMTTFTTNVLANAQGDWETGVIATMLGEGTYDIVAQTADLAGNASQATGSFSVDLTAPTAVLTAPTNNAYLSNKRPSFFCTTEASTFVTYNIYDQNNVLVHTHTVQASAQGTCNYTSMVDILDGQYTLDLVTKDAVGNERTQTNVIIFTIDTVPPGLVITKPTGIIGSQNPNIEGTTQAGLLVDVVLKKGGTTLLTTTATADAQGIWRTGPISVLLTDGLHTIEASTKDAANNSNQAQGTFTVDTSTPILSIDSPSPDEHISDRNVQITGMTNPGQMVVVVIMDTQGRTISTDTVTGNAQGQWTLTKMLMADGSYQIEAEATNAFGRKSNINSTFIVDTELPTLTIISPVDNAIYTTQPNIKVQDNDTASSIDVKILDEQGSIVQQGAANKNMDTWLYTPPVLDDGTYTIEVTATDLAGNQITVTHTFTIDTTAPVLSIISPIDDAKIIGLRPTFNGTSDTDEIEVLIQTQNGQQLAQNTVTVTNGAWSWTPQMDLPTDTLIFTATAQDDAGNATSQSITIHISLKLILELNAPTANLITSENQPTWRGKLNQPAKTLLFNNDTLLTTFDVTENELSWTWDKYTQPLEDGEHELYAQATTPDGQDVTTTPITITIDTLAPSLSILTPEAGELVESDELTITGQTEVGINGVVLTTTDGDKLTLPVAQDGSFFYVWSQIPEGEHIISASAKDAAGNDANTGGIKFTVKYPSVIIEGGDNGTIRNNTPSFSGEAKPDSKITVTIFNEDGDIVHQGTTTAGDDSKWRYKVKDPLPDGRYTVEIEIEEPGSNVKKKRRIELIINEFTPPALDIGYCSASPHRTPSLPGLGLLLMMCSAFFIRRRRAS